MKLATVRTPYGDRAVRVDDDALVDLGYSDVGALLATEQWRRFVQSVQGQSLEYLPHLGANYPLTDVEYGRLIAAPSKVICVGLNYASHIDEMKMKRPAYPTLFSKFTDALLAPNDDIVKPAEVAKLDWESELTVVIGTEIHRATLEEAENAIAGFTVMNDSSCRDWQFRTEEWLQGKNWDSLTPVGPIMVTPDELGGVRPSLRITSTVNGELMQDGITSDLVFDPVELVQYISQFIRLRPGDLIATGTPGGVGMAQTPTRFLQPGDVVVCEIEGIGALRNTVVAE